MTLLHRGHYSQISTRVLSWLLARKKEPSARLGIIRSRSCRGLDGGDKRIFFGTSLTMGINVDDITHT